MSESLLQKDSHPNVPYTPSVTPHPVHRIGLLGLGAMGYPMARNLARHLASQFPTAPPLMVYNRTVKKSDALAAELLPVRIAIASSARQLALECDVIITSLANDAAVKSVYVEFAQALTGSPSPSSKIFVETSTIYPALAGELDTLISSANARLVTCPVIGRPSVAEKAQLLILMSGDYRSKKEVAYHLVPAVGRKVIDLGGNLEKAPTFKLIANSLILGSMEVIAESMTLAEKSGIGSESVHNLIKDLFPAEIMVNYAERMAHDRFDGRVGFAIEGGIKDASHIRRLMNEHSAPMPTIDVAYQHLITARALHEAQTSEGKELFDVLDWSAIVAGSRVAAGLDGFDSQKHESLVKED